MRSKRTTATCKRTVPSVMVCALSYSATALGGRCRQSRWCVHRSCSRARGAIGPRIAARSLSTTPAWPAPRYPAEDGRSPHRPTCQSPAGPAAHQVATRPVPRSVRRAASWLSARAGQTWMAPCRPRQFVWHQNVRCARSAPAPCGPSLKR